MDKELESKSPIIFYCKDCEKIVDTDRVGKKYVYKCKLCGTKNVAFGTEKSIKNFFRIKDE
jgi:Zn finger protein HypA/HybF involved in hydrogenase expression